MKVLKKTWIFHNPKCNYKTLPFYGRFSHHIWALYPKKSTFVPIWNRFPQNFHHSHPELVNRTYYVCIRTSQKVANKSIFLIESLLLSIFVSGFWKIQTILENMYGTVANVLAISVKLTGATLVHGTVHAVGFNITWGC